MSSHLTPYNFTISDQSPLFQYLPFRDGPIQTSWNVTYAYDQDSTWVPDTFIGAGPSSHRTQFVGASVQLDWVGTAVYLYGEGSQDGYTIELDGTWTNQTSTFLSTPGLLFSQSNLTYGPHTLVLQVVKSGATIFNATITVGMGELGTIVQNRTMLTTSVPNNFTLSAGWTSQTSTYAYTQTVVPRIATNTQGSSISFPLNSASAFYIVGSVNYNHGAFDVTVTPTPNTGSQLNGMYNGSSRWIGLDTMLYLATGLNRTETYQIEMTSVSPGRWLDVSSVVVLDTPPSSQSSAPSHGSSKHLGIGPIVGIAVAAGFVLLAFVGLVFYCQWRRQRGTKKQDNFMIEQEHHPAADILSTSYQLTPFPLGHLPNIDPSVPVWIDQHGRGEKLRSTHRGPASSTSFTSPLNSSEGEWGSSILTVDRPEHIDQSRTMTKFGGSEISKPPSLADLARLMNLSDRSLIPDVPMGGPESEYSGVPGEIHAPDTPPAYNH